jgi:LytS/YehU family sensor histidine kinase
MAWQPESALQPSWLTPHAAWLLFSLWLATAAWLVWALRRLDEARREKGELLAALAGSSRDGRELSELRDRLNPHFLFNALNTIRFYARTDPQVARELLLDLSEFLKGVVDSNECSTLAEELDRALSYLKLEQARLGERLELQLDVEEPPFTLAFPTRLLQPLFALLLKRSSGAESEGWRIAVRCHVDEEAVRVSLSDNQPGAVPSPEQLSRWRSRLERHCPGSTLEVEHGPVGGQMVTLTLTKWRTP